MNAHKIVRLFFVPAILSLLAAEAPGLADTTKGLTRLVRPDPFFDMDAVVPDANARGTLAIETKLSSGRDRLDVTIKNVDKTQIYNLFVEDPEEEGAFNAFIPLTGQGNTKKLKLDTDKGDALPYAVTSWDTLVGMEVRIVVGLDPEADAAIYLRGHVPGLDLPKAKLNTEQNLSLAIGATDPNANGTVQIFSQASSGDERIVVKVKKLDFVSNIFSLWIEDAPLSGTFSNAGPFLGSSKNSGTFERRTKSGEPLPTGETSAADFSGRIVEVRNQLDATFLSTLIPQVN
jgi:hypothetical protein